jgi:hypothetical protein
MITKTANPVEWAILMYELDDAKEHLENLIAEITEADEPDEIDFGMQLEHIYSHLNRAWNAEITLGIGAIKISSALANYRGTCHHSRPNQSMKPTAKPTFADI